ncbi:HAMP domain-containing histidine kinase [Streptomyces sp. A7024]|uniref:histidine kinase n=1 Tax=Streptomyces coryli TaxID=1128680 RepID=A0A6G4U863_9ACTN|nr:HAMP domain-containing sensor histidine kinase [Streptomyces coryli]NGN68303.1 HAMP domain-containing histidine kinase [Streptomyces coryli]
MSLRTRLTLIYGGLFLAAGVVLLGVTYALFSQQMEAGKAGSVESTRIGPSGEPPEGPTVKAFKSEVVEQTRDDVLDAAATSLMTQGGLALLVVGAAAAGFGWLVAGRVLAPMHRVTETARRIAAAPAADRGLHERIALNGPKDEVKELADSFDTMVERLDHSFDGQRRFIANASHELRTPLTVGRAMVELAMNRKQASDDVKQLGEGLMQINTRHERLITGLLLLATSENEVTERRPVDLADVADHVAGQVAAEARAVGVTVTASAGEALTTGDALLLERLVYNLVENGIRHNAADGGWVEVTTAVGADGSAELRVANSGPVVPPYEVPALFEPFRRLAPDRPLMTKGAGLGLSIVRSVARAHDGEVTALPRAGGGLVVTVCLPAAGRAAAKAGEARPVARTA